MAAVVASRVVETLNHSALPSPYATGAGSERCHAGLDAALAASAARYGWQAGRIEAERIEGSAKARTPKT